MPTLTGIGLAAITIDVLVRVSFILTACLLLALSARKNAAFQHAILVAGLAGTFLVPAAILTLHLLSVSRWEFGWPGHIGRNAPAAVAVVEAQPSSVPHDRPTTPHPPASPNATTRGDGAPQHLGQANSARSGEPFLEPRLKSTSNSPARPWIAYGLISMLLIGAVVRVMGLGLSLIRLRRIVARATPVTGHQVLSRLQMIQRQIPLRHPPLLLESTDVSVPVAAGAVGNYVLLPTGWAGRWQTDADEALAVLGHECAHLARRDHRVVILQELLASLLWFHPLVHWFNHMLNRVREEVCDNHAIAVVDRASYCEVLLLLALGRPATPPRGATSMWPGRWSLEDRVREILDEQRPTKTRISGVARSAIATFSLATTSLIALPQLTASPSNNRIATTADARAARREKTGPVANEMTRNLIKFFPVNGKKMLRFENLAGRVELMPGEGPMVKVEANVRVGELAEGEASRLIDEIRWMEAPAEDGESRWGLALPEGRYPTVRYAVSGESPPGVTTVSHLGRKIRLSSHPGAKIPAVEFDLRIAIPPQARVAIHNAVGPVGGVNLSAPLQVTTLAGSIQLRHVRAPFTASSDLGPIMITDLESDASLHTGSGGIELTRVASGRVDLTTHSGGCRIIQPPDAPFTLRNVGERAVTVFADGIRRSPSDFHDRRVDVLSRGSGGPVITVDAGTSDCILGPTQ